MTRSLSFVVDAQPAPQGSMMARATKGGKAYIHHSNAADVTRWRKAVKTAADARSITAIRQVPLVVTMAFNTGFAPRTRRDVHDGDYCATTPDLDKLIRSTGDALTGSRALVDDAQIVALHASKRYGRPGASITISDVPPALTPRARLLRLVAQLNALAGHVDIGDLPRPVIAGLAHLTAYQPEGGAA